jgi:hypothetical protein
MSNKFPGNRGLVETTSNGTPFVVEVTIVGSKSAYGRTDVLVTGKRGVHLPEAWVDLSKLIDTTDAEAVAAATAMPEKADA